MNGQNPPGAPPPGYPGGPPPGQPYPGGAPNPYQAPQAPAGYPPPGQYGYPPMFKPHRGGVILTLGILGIVCCMICGIIAWVMGNTDLAEIDAGIMDPTGRGLVNAGRICGIIGVVLNVLLILLSVIVNIAATDHNRHRSYDNDWDVLGKVEGSLHPGRQPTDSEDIAAPVLRPRQARHRALHPRPGEPALGAVIPASMPSTKPGHYPAAPCERSRSPMCYNAVRIT